MPLLRIKLLALTLSGIFSACAVTPPDEPKAAATAAAKGPEVISAEMDARIAVIHQQFLFSDMHAHPSRFHRANVPMVSAEEVALYQRAHMDVAVANISADAPYGGRYWLGDGSEIPRGRDKPEPGSGFAFSMDRKERLQGAFD